MGPTLMRFRSESCFGSERRADHARGPDTTPRLLTDTVGKTSMVQESVVVQISRQFDDEVRDLQDYIAFFQSQTKIETSEIVRINETLERRGLRKLPVNESAQSYLLRDAEVHELMQVVGEVAQQINREKQALARKRDALPGLHPPQRLPRPQFDVFIGIVNYLGQQAEVVNDKSLRELLEIIESSEITEEFKKQSPLSAEEWRATLDRAARMAGFLNIHGQIVSLEVVEEKFQHFAAISRARQTNSPTSPYRQAFISLMATFDATVFDLVRTALNSRFFELASAFDNESVSIADILKEADFGSFTTKFVERQLQPMYIGSLLSKVRHHWKVEVANISSDPKAYERLQEMVNRRNLHIHNRGIVNQRYLDKKLNLDRFTLGDYAVVDEPYWNDATDKTLYCVRELADWAQATGN